jgi:integrase
MSLTNVEIKAAKPSDKPRIISDGGGLHLKISPTGTKHWRLAYRFGGQQKLLSLGPYPDVSLFDARAKRQEVKGLLRDGKDPVEVSRAKTAEALIAKSNTFQTAAEEYIAYREDVTVSTRGKYEWYMRDVLPADFRERALDDITAGLVSDVLLNVHRSGRRETARKVRFFISRVFQYAGIRGRTERNPVVATKGVLPTHQTRSHAAITDPAKLGALVAAVEEYDGWPTLRWALQIAALCFVRPGEVRGATWGEIDFKKAIWRIPGERMKMKQPHDVPLSKQALAVFNEARRLELGSNFIFPQINNPKRTISENAMNVTLRRMGYSKEEHTAHGFRSSASTILNGAKFRADVIERQLAHVEANAVRKAYNRQEYWEERVEMMQAWANMLDKFKALSLI